MEWTDDYYHRTDTNAGMKSLAGLPYDEDTTFTAKFQKAGEEPGNTISVISCGKRHVQQWADHLHGNRGG